jgi:3-methylcrotonyl-CoA carboxylase alpha subunit
MMFERVLIANRGEIACRIIRTCRRLGIHTIAVYSEADATAQHVRLADEAWPIGGPRPVDSYLRGDAIVEVAKKSGAQAIHPGYGFLSENADFVEAVESAGIVFIGPSADSMKKMGSKAGAKDLMSAHKVPVVPGYTGEDQNPQTLAREAQRIGFPLMIKAAHGGGGKGMRIVRSLEEFAPSLESCQREAKNAFGRDRVLLERYIETPRHIEFQIFGDKHGNIIHLNERECSAQRRYQKVLEETPSPFVTPDLRTRMGDAAIAAGRALDYVNAGTVEFIVAPSGEFFFMEINTRLQVEHPVTEMTLHLDLVELQLRVAAGDAIPGSLLRNKSIPQDGHAIELRLYAEDPQKNFLPDSGKLRELRLPQTNEHVRIDSGVVQGDTVTIFYDPMIAKLIAWDRTRTDALQRMREALAQCDIVGLKSNIEFLERLVRHPAVVEGRIDTGYLDRHLDEFLPSADAKEIAPLFAAATAVLLGDAATPSPSPDDPHSPWSIRDTWRMGHPGRRVIAFQRDGERIDVVATGSGANFELSVGDQHCAVAHATQLGDTVSGEFNGAGRRFRALVSNDRVLLHDGERRTTLQRVDAFAFEKSAQRNDDRVAAPMPGRIVVVRAKPGDEVVAGQELIVMEAMKMEIALKAPHAGVIDSVSAAVGDFVEADTVLVKFVHAH